LDGIMAGRGIFHDPFIFSENSPWQNWNKGQKLELFAKHIELYLKTYKKNERRFEALRKFCKVYINGFEGASELRAQFMQTNSPQEALQLLEHGGDGWI
jgi:tRNA-dihydrouridine synthase